jgi:hypothetical protein
MPTRNSKKKESDSNHSNTPIKMGIFGLQHTKEIF